MERDAEASRSSAPRVARPRCGRAGRARCTASRGRDGAPLAGALQLAVLPPDRARRPRARSTGTAALRPGVPRERGLRPVDAAASRSPTARTSPSRSCSSACIPGRPRCGAATCRSRSSAEIALREIARIAPELGAEQAELAWGLGSGRTIDDATRADASLAAAGCVRGSATASIARCAQCGDARARATRAASSRSSQPPGSPCVAQAGAEHAARTIERLWLGARRAAAAVRVAVVSPGADAVSLAALRPRRARPEASISP